MPIEIIESTRPDMTEEESNHWLDGLGALDRDNETIALTIMTLYRKPPTMFDVGSGTGCFVNTWRSNGIEAYGVDRLPREAWPHLFEADLTKPFKVNKEFDLVTCVEVAEHLPIAAADILCDTLAGLLKVNGILVFTSAQPGQPGDGHVNCQPAEYWRAKLDSRKIIFRECATFRTMLALRTMNHPFRHIEANLQVMTRGE